MKLLILLLLIPQIAASYSYIDYAQGPSEAKDYVHVAWSKFLDGALDPVSYNILKSHSSFAGLGKVDLLKISEMDTAFSSDKRAQSIRINSLSPSEALKLASNLSFFQRNKIIFSSKSRRELNKAIRLISSVGESDNLSRSDLRDIMINTPDLSRYNNAQYLNQIQLFLLCRENRDYACRFVLKNIYGNFVLNEKGTPWSLPALAKSAKNLAFNQVNGQTPTGVHQINSVMPMANKFELFGKYRRLILDWIPASRSQMLTKQFLPRSQHQKNWWKRASIARDVGRLHLRVHGTGRLNKDPLSTWYPHMPTAGCISTREGRYVDKSYMGQRLILDKLLFASRLLPSYSNEENINGILWVVNIGSQKRAVSAKDIEDLHLLN